MSDASFDVEAGLPGESAETRNIINARHKLRIKFLIIRSAQLFKLGANCAGDISSSSTESSYGLNVGGPQLWIHAKLQMTSAMDSSEPANDMRFWNGVDLSSHLF